MSTEVNSPAVQRVIDLKVEAVVDEVCDSVVSWLLAQDLGDAETAAEWEHRVHVQTQQLDKYELGRSMVLLLIETPEYQRRLAAARDALKGVRS